MIYKTTGLVWEGWVDYFRLISIGWMFHSLGGYAGFSPRSALNWFIYISPKTMWEEDMTMNDARVLEKHFITVGGR